MPRKPIRKKARDLEKTYPTKQFVAKLQRLVDALETGKPLPRRLVQLAEDFDRRCFHGGKLVR